MPLMGSLHVGNSGLQTSQNALNTTAHNITNADTKGYVRQQTLLGDKKYNLLAIDASAVANKQTGLGVTYQEVRQVRDVFLDETYREENGRLSFYDTEYDSISEIETLLGEMDGASFGESINDLWVAVQELSKDPSSPVTQGLLMQRAYAFVTDAQSVYQGLCDYQDNLNNSIGNTVSEINDIGHKIWDLNEAIRKIENGGVEHANDLKDQRNMLLDDLSGYGKIDYRTDVMGNVLVNFEGHAFVTATRVNELATQIDETTGFRDLFWKDDASKTVTEDGTIHYEIENAKVFDIYQEISSAIDTDIGKLKAQVITRGDHRAIFTDSEGENYNKISNSIVMTAQAEFDKLIHSVVNAVNGVLKDAFEAGDGKYMADENGNALQIFNRKVSAVDTAEDPTKTETLFTVQNLVINEDLMQIPTKLGFVKPDGSVDYETVDKLKKMFEEANYTLNPTASTMLNINSFYAAFVSDIANIGSVVKNVRDNEQLTVDSTENARQQIIGVSTDEELSNMIRYQNAYNASSRYINVINEMLEHLLTSLT
ncbi:MAG: flagellar hook-associated protein FlgK [Lachnospiraceae bacterium]|nr:flagellar hook-associated protein FlgK [Lachnospiraceae bacterium]